MRIAVYHNMMSGGNKRSLYEKIRGFRKYGHEVHVFNLSISDESFMDLHEVADEVVTTKVAQLTFRGPLAILNPIFQILQIMPVWLANRRVARLLNEGDFDLVWVGNCFVTQHPILLRYLKKPHILYTAEHLRAHYEQVFWDRVGGAAGRQGPLKMLRRLVLRTAFFIKACIDHANIRGTQNVLVNSYFTKENLLRYYGATALPLYLGIDLGKFRPLKLEKENTVVSVGGLSLLKGHDLVVQSVGLIPAETRPRLVIVADRIDNHAEAKRYEELAQAMGVDLDIRQGITDKEVVELYNRSSLTVCANLLEPFGLVPLESMACGTPVVAVNEGGFRETVQHGMTGLHAERDAAALASAIEAALQDRERLRDWGANGVSLVHSRFSLETHWANLEHQLQSVATTGEIDYSPPAAPHSAEPVKEI